MPDDDMMGTSHDIVDQRGPFFQDCVTDDALFSIDEKVQEETQQIEAVAVCGENTPQS